MWYLDVIKALQKDRCQFAVAGGFAVALHGFQRGTIDLDLCIAMNFENLVKIESTLRGLNLVSRIPVGASEIFKFRQEYIRNRNLIAWSFVDPKNPAHVVDLIITEDLRKLALTNIKMFGIGVPVISKNALIKMKQKAGQPQDLEDVRALKNRKKESNEKN